MSRRRSNHLHGSDIDQVIASYFEQIDAGQEVDPAQVIHANPEHAAQLGEFFDSLGVLYKTIEHTLGTDSSEANASGETLGDFRIIQELGRGGMGVVYEAEQISVKRPVCIEVLNAGLTADAAQLARFRQEVQAVASLNHDHVIPVYTVGEQNGTYFYAMKLIRGTTLDHAMESGSVVHPLVDTPPIASDDTSPDLAEVETSKSSPRSTMRNGSYKRICKLVRDVALTIEHAHANGIVHRDLKPSNLLLDKEGKIWVSDFGLARIESEATLTGTGDILGTVQYMSPEQALGQSNVDGRSDVYSLGVILYRMLTDELPFRGKHRMVLHQPGKRRSDESEDAESRYSSRHGDNLFKVPREETCAAISNRTSTRG